MKAYLLRRRKLGKTSCNAIGKLSKTGITVILNEVDEIPENADICIRWGCTANVPQRKVINRAEAIHLVTDKTKFREILNKEKLCPETWFNEKNVKFPCIVRPQNHHQGRHLYFCKDKNELDSAILKCGDNWYASEFIDKIAEYRVFCMQGRAIIVASKIPPNEKAIAWNVAQGGEFENVRWDDWPLKAVKIALEGFELSGLDFGGVDIMVDKNNNCFILEINSAPSLTSPYRQECFAKGLDWMIEKGKDKIPLIQERGGYRKFIHPAVCERAILPNKKEVEVPKFKIPEPVKNEEWEKNEILKLIPKKKCFEYPPHNNLKLQNNAFVSLDEHGRISIHMELDSWLGAKLENFEFDAAPFVG